MSNVLTVVATDYDKLVTLRTGKTVTQGGDSSDGVVAEMSTETVKAGTTQTFLFEDVVRVAELIPAVAAYPDYNAGGEAVG